MTKTYYEGIEFPELEEKPEAKPTNEGDRLEKVDFSTAMTDIRRMMRAIESGQSDLRRGSLLLDKAPMKTAAAHLENMPSEDNLRNFLDLCEQDINSRFRLEAEKIFKGADKRLKKFIEGLEEARKKALEEARKLKEKKDD